MKIDRALQRQILEFLRTCYPNSADTTALPCSSHPEFQGNLHYLVEHRLVDGSRIADAPGYVMARLTIHGIDLLEDDGGLEAIRSAQSCAPGGAQRIEGTK